MLLFFSDDKLLIAVCSGTELNFQSVEVKLTVLVFPSMFNKENYNVAT
jgi:hypothetical protein